MHQGFCSMPQPNTTGKAGPTATGANAGGPMVDCYAGGPKTGIGHMGINAGLCLGM
jgi:hypothetical protein